MEDVDSGVVTVSEAPSTPLGRNRPVHLTGPVSLPETPLTEAQGENDSYRTGEVLGKLRRPMMVDRDRRRHLDPLFFRVDF